MDAHYSPDQDKQDTRIAKVIPLQAGLGTANQIVNLLCPSAEGLHIIPISDISHCTASGNYVNIHYGDGQSLLIAKTLRAVGLCLPADKFIKPHQSYLVAFDRIRLLTQDEVVLSSGDRLPISRANRNFLREAIQCGAVKLK